MTVQLHHIRAKMMQIQRQMMQIPRTGLPAPESAYYLAKSRQITHASRQIPGVRLPAALHSRRLPRRWNEFAETAGVAEDWREGIGRQLA